MPAPPGTLIRGAVCHALYPFTSEFPLDRVVRDHEDELKAELERHQDIDDIVRIIRPPEVPEVVTRLKLRRVLLLQDGTDPRRPDITVLRLNSLPRDVQQNQPGHYRRLLAGSHPTRLLLPPSAELGITKEVVVDCMAVNTIAKASILERKGMLPQDLMREVSERLVTALELDISRTVEQRARLLSQRLS